MASRGLVLAALLGAALATQCALDRGYDYWQPGGQPTWTGVADAEACCSLCANATATCAAFSFKAGNCYSKTSTTGRRADSTVTSGTNPAYAPPPPCRGEFVACPGSGECAMTTNGCGNGCTAGQYVCPSDHRTCVDSAADYAKCPGMTGTHLDASLGVEQRLDFLVKHTTLEEQIAQLTNTAPEIARLGIPSYQWLNDDQHGVARTPARATVFPNGAGLGATWSATTLHEVGRVVGTEARGLHRGFLDADPSRSMGCNGCSLTMYAPNLNLVRDPRWGRAQEVFGEDPTHMSRLVVGMVTGAQNNSAGRSVGPDGRHLLAGSCCKHFAAYDVEGGAGTADRFTFDAELNARDMWETYMPAFKACITEAKASHVMCSYNSVQGVPTCGNKGLLTTILRDQWGFDGFVVSDYDAWAFINDRHHYTQNMEDAAALGIGAGLDQEGGGNSAISQLATAVKDGKAEAGAVATAFRRLFRLRIKLGMLDPPTEVPYNEIGPYNATELQFNAEHVAVAARAAREAMTLLKNNAKTLPLASQSIRKLAVVGPQANVSGILFGNYAGSANTGNWGPSIVDALRTRLGRDAVQHSMGLLTIGAPTSPDQFRAAQAATQAADATVVVLGLAFDEFCTGDDDGKDDYCEKEGNDRKIVELPQGQADMVRALRAAAPTKPLVAVMVHGGAIALANETLSALDAVLDAWYPGLGGGDAITGALFGDYSPGGRSPVTWYRSTGDLPPLGEMSWYPNASAGTKGVSYRYFQGEPLFPFGFGLSYSSFAYSGLSLSTAHTPISACDTITATVTVQNTGSVDADEVVQAYTKQPNATVPVPQVRLSAFERVHIAAGASVTVQLLLSPGQRAVVRDGDTSGEAVYTASTQQYVEPGEIHVFVGGGQPDFYTGALSAVATISGPAAALSSCD